MPKVRLKDYINVIVVEEAGAYVAVVRKVEAAIANDAGVGAIVEASGAGGVELIATGVVKVTGTRVVEVVGTRIGVEAAGTDSVAAAMVVSGYLWA